MAEMIITEIKTTTRTATEDEFRQIATDGTIRIAQRLTELSFDYLEDELAITEPSVKEIEIWLTGAATNLEAMTMVVQKFGPTFDLTSLREYLDLFVDLTNVFELMQDLRDELVSADRAEAAPEFNEASDTAREALDELRAKLGVTDYSATEARPCGSGCQCSNSKKNR